MPYDKIRVVSQARSPPASYKDIRIVVFSDTVSDHKSYLVAVLIWKTGRPLDVVAVRDNGELCMRCD